MTEGMNAPAGSLYRPTLIRVIGWTMRSPAPAPAQHLAVARRQQEARPRNSGCRADEGLQIFVALPHGVPEEAYPVA
jgi:hypothetical protein